MALITFDAVSMSYGGQAGVHDLCLTIEAAERLVILGPSGCGKTTVLRLLAGFLVPETGRIHIGGECVAADGRLFKPPEARHLGMVFQDLALWPHMTVRRNLAFGLDARGVPRAQRRRRVADLLDRVQMTAWADARPVALSGGQQQRVALARALVLKPRALLMDEPLSSLDHELNVRLRREILRLQAQTGFALVYVTHDREEAFDMGTRVVVMQAGRIARCGPVAQIRAHFDALGRA